MIALWLGHESVETTQIYLEATLAMKEQALAKTTPPNGRSAAISRAISCSASSTACKTRNYVERYPRIFGFRRHFGSDSASNRPSLGIVRDPA